jgi:hypothetical protein
VTVVIEPDKTAVITCMDYNYEVNLSADFLETLRGMAGYRGKVVVMDYGMTDRVKEKIKQQYEVAIVKCVKDRHLFSIRFRDLVKVIAGLPDEVTHVMAIDGGDVWFQAPVNELFDLCDRKLGYVEEGGGGDAADNVWNRAILQRLSFKHAHILFQNFRGTRIKNAGMICGPRQAVTQIAALINQYVIHCKIDVFGIDQVFFNYVVNRMAATEKILLPEKFNYVLIERKGQFGIANKLIYDALGQLVTIVHNAGGNYRVIPKMPHPLLDRAQYHEVLKIDESGKKL